MMYKSNGSPQSDVQKAIAKAKAMKAQKINFAPLLNALDLALQEDFGGFDGVVNSASDEMIRWIRQYEANPSAVNNRTVRFGISQNTDQIYQWMHPRPHPAGKELRRVAKEVIAQLYAVYKNDIEFRATAIQEEFINANKVHPFLSTDGNTVTVKRTPELWGIERIYDAEYDDPLDELWGLLVNTDGYQPPSTGKTNAVTEAFRNLEAYTGAVRIWTALLVSYPQNIISKEERGNEIFVRVKNSPLMSDTEVDELWKAFSRNVEAVLDELEAKLTEDSMSVESPDETVRSIIKSAKMKTSKSNDNSWTMQPHRIAKSVQCVEQGDVFTFSLNPDSDSREWLDTYLEERENLFPSRLENDFFELFIDIEEIGAFINDYNSKNDLFKRAFPELASRTFVFCDDGEFYLHEIAAAADGDVEILNQMKQKARFYVYEKSGSALQEFVDTGKVVFKRYKFEDGGGGKRSAGKSQLPMTRINTSYSNVSNSIRLEEAVIELIAEVRDNQEAGEELVAEMPVDIIDTGRGVGEEGFSDKVIGRGILSIELVVLPNARNDQWVLKYESENGKVSVAKTGEYNGDAVAARVLSSQLKIVSLRGQ